MCYLSSIFYFVFTEVDGKYNEYYDHIFEKENFSHFLKGFSRSIIKSRYYFNNSSQNLFKIFFKSSPNKPKISSYFFLYPPEVSPVHILHRIIMFLK